jgi:MFS transporter, DHA2 family, multidrug resistance protein
VTVAVLFLVDFDKPNFPLLRRLDYISLGLLAAFLGSLEYVLEEGPGNDWFQDSTIFAFAIVTVVAGVGFFYRAFTAKEPIVDLRAFADRNFATGSLFSFVIGIGLYGLVLMFPLFLARVRGYDSLQIGETMFVTGGFMMVTAPIAGALGQKLDPRLMMFAGLGLFALSCVELLPITKDWSYTELFVPQAMRGVGMMIAMIPVNILALGTLPPERVKNASGLFNLMRNLGGAVGLAILVTELNNRTDLHFERLRETVTWSRDTVTERLSSMAHGMTASLGSNADTAALRQLAGLVRQQAMTMAFSDIFLIIATVFAGALFLIPLARRPRPAGAAAGAH